MNPPQCTQKPTSLTLPGPVLLPRFSNLWSPKPVTAVSKLLAYPHEFSTRFLYRRYASSQNHYFTRDINEFIHSVNTPCVVTFYERLALAESEELLRRVYFRHEQRCRVQNLTEYYKFHIEIPRLFLLPVAEIINKHHDRKRRLNYLRVTKMIGMVPEQEMLTGESETSLARGSESESLNQVSLTSVLPADLKRQLNDVGKQRPNLQSRAQETSCSVTVRELDSFLDQIFHKKGFSPRSTDIGERVKLCPKVFQKIKFNFTRNLGKKAQNNEKSGTSAEQQLRLQMKTQATQSGLPNEIFGNRQPTKSPSKTAGIKPVFADFNDYLGADFQRLDRHTRTLTDNLKSQNYNIKNLNINIQLQTMNADPPPGKGNSKAGQRLLWGGKDIGQELTLNLQAFGKANAPKLSIKVESPTFSLLNKFKAVNELCKERRAEEEGERRPEREEKVLTVVSRQLQQPPKSAEKTRVMRLPGASAVKTNNENQSRNRVTQTLNLLPSDTVILQDRSILKTLLSDKLSPQMAEKCARKTQLKLATPALESAKSHPLMATFEALQLRQPRQEQRILDSKETNKMLKNPKTIDTASEQKIGSMQSINCTAKQLKSGKSASRDKTHTPAFTRGGNSAFKAKMSKNEQFRKNFTAVLPQLSTKKSNKVAVHAMSKSPTKKLFSTTSHLIVEPRRSRDVLLKPNLLKGFGGQSDGKAVFQKRQKLTSERPTIAASGINSRLLADCFAMPKISRTITGQAQSLRRVAQETHNFLTKH